MSKEENRHLSRRTVLSGRRIGLALLTLGAVTVVVVSSTGAGDPEERDGGGAIEKKADTPPQELREHWTPERIREASQNDPMPVVPEDS